jgi:hypothetical protein
MEYPVGTVSPYAVAIVVTTSPDVVGTDVVSARMEVRRPDGTTVDWSPVTVSGGTATTVQVNHTLQSGDLEQAGAYLILCWLDDGSTEYRTAYPVTLTARAKWARS